MERHYDREKKQSHTYYDIFRSSTGGSLARRGVEDALRLALRTAHPR
jgi:hypothetical protein